MKTKTHQVIALLWAVSTSISFASTSKAASTPDDAVVAYNRKDYATVFKIFTDMANQGDAFAQTFIGWMYDNGEGVPENDAEAVKWFRKAADQGHVRAQVFLATRYASGNGVQKDLVESAKWFTRAAELGDVNAQVSLAAMYDKGEGLTADLVQAYKWVSIAANRGAGKAKTLRDALVKKMSPAQIEEAERLVVGWKPTS